MKILCDIDDVLFPLCDHVQRIMDMRGISKGRKIDRWDMHESFGVTREELWRVIFREYRRGLLQEAPYEGVRDVLTALRDVHGHTVHLVTARGSEGELGNFVKMETVRWLARWDIPCDSLTFTPDKTILRGDVFLDDSPTNVRAMRGCGIPSYLMAAPHNENNQLYLLPTVYSLDEFAKVIEPDYRTPQSPIATVDVVA